MCGDIQPNPGPALNLKDVSACHINIRGLNESKMTAIKTSIWNVYDIITISETFLSDNSTVDLSLPGYHPLIRRDRPTFGGGVAVFIKENLIYRRRLEFECLGLENIWVEISSQSGKLFICTIYRPPNADDFWDQFEFNVETVKDSCNNPRLLIMGDLNADFNSINGRKLKAFCQNQNLMYHVTEPTRITDNSATCLDQILSNMPNLVTEIVIDPPVCTNDHCTVGIYLNFKILRDKPYFRHIWMYKEGDYVGFRNALSSFNWDICFINKSVTEACNMWTETVLNFARTFIPNKNVLIRPKDLPWYNNELRKLKRNLIRVFKKARRVKSEYQWGRYKELKKVYNERLVTAENEYYASRNESLSTSHNSKFWWKTVNEVLGRKNNDTYPPLFNESNNTYINNNLEKATMFNNFFLSHNHVDTTNASIPVDEVELGVPILSDVRATEQDVYDYISTIDPSKATGPDGISPRLLKLADRAIVPSLTRLVNMSLQENIVPDSWKAANVIPLHKKDDRDKLNNYRPVSILPAASKVLERIVFKHMYNFFHTNKLLTDNQSGFRQKDSTINQLAYLYHTFCNALDLKQDIRVVFCDIHKAFDKVWHDGLIFKLNQMGVRGNVLEWLKDYLNSRKQRVIIKGETSDWGSIEAGVPQGSVLGPLLFLVYINDIVQNVNCGIKLFADDTILHLELDDPLLTANILNDSLNSINSWANKWLVEFSPSKTKTMCISLKQDSQVSDFPLKFNNVPLEEVHSHKHLGIVFNDKLKWSNHIDYIINSVKKITDVFRKLKFKLDRKTLHNIYVTFVRPKLEYGSILYDDCTEWDKNRLECVQLTFARVICGAKKGTSHDAIYKETSLPKLECRRKESKLTFMHKTVNKNVPPYLHDILPHSHNVHYNLRNNDEQKQFHFHTVKFQKSLYPDCIKLWNELDSSVRQVESLSIFKKLVLNSLVPNVLYNGFTRVLSIIHAQLRMKCSNLRSDLFKLHVIDSPQCLCMTGIEDSFHYFFECPLYNQERVRLFNKIQPICNISIDTLLFGNELLSFEENIEIFKYIETYIHETERFA